MRGSGTSRHEYAVLDRGSACLQCKRRKKRCDGVHPVCGPCQRFGTADSCEFPRPPTPKLKPKPSPPRSKSEAMRMQIRDLEGQLAALQNALQQRDASMGGPSRGASGLLLPPQPEHSEFEWTSQHRTADDDDDIDNDDPEFSSFPRVESPHQHTHSPDPFRNPAMYDDLLQNFLTHRKRCAFECDEARFVARFNASPESPDAMHPGLVSAVLLVGYYFPPLTSSHDQVPLGGGIPGGHRDPRMEARFLQQTKDYLAHSLTSADRLPDFLRGTALLVWYYFVKGRLQEARYHAAGVACFAAACRLHLQSHPSLANLGVAPSMAINDPHHNQPTQIIPPAASPLEAEERISLFWTIFLLDRFASLSGDTNPSIPDNEIWTNWPRDPSEWESPRADIPFSMPTITPETLFPVLDYSSGGSDANRVIPKNSLSLRAVSAFVLERSAHLAKATSPNVSQLSLLQRQYDTPYLQRSLDSTKAAARKISRWLAPTPSSILITQAQLSGGDSNVYSGAMGSQGVRGHDGISPHAFHAPPLAPSEGDVSRGTPYPPTGSFSQAPLHRSSSSVPHSPHGIQRGFAHQQASHLRQSSPLGSPSDTAALLLAHSTVCTAHIHLQTATQNLSSDVTRSTNAEYYRPSSSQSQPSFQAPSSHRPSRPTSASGVYQGPQFAQPVPHGSAPFVQFPPVVNPTATAGDATSWPVWNASAPGGVQNQPWAGPTGQAQYPSAPPPVPQTSFAPQTQTYPALDVVVDPATLSAASEVADLASAAMRLPYVFDELDMMIRWTWIPALEVLRREIQRQERELSTQYNVPHQGYQYPSAPHYPANDSSAAFVQPMDPSSPLPRLRAQRDTLRHALDRLSGMFQLGGACSSLSDSLHSPTPAPTASLHHSAAPSTTSHSSSTSPTMTSSSERVLSSTSISFDQIDVSGVGSGMDGMFFKVETDPGHSSPFIRCDATSQFPGMTLGLEQECPPQLFLSENQLAGWHQECSQQIYFDALASVLQYPSTH